jgi:hypothetical protein
VFNFVNHNAFCPCAGALIFGKSEAYTYFYEQSLKEERIASFFESGLLGGVSQVSLFTLFTGTQETHGHS